MKVPGYIKYKMRRAARLAKETEQTMAIVQDWFTKQGYDEDSLRSGDGYSLEQLEYGIDITDEFCEWVEHMTPAECIAYYNYTYQDPAK